MSDKYTKIDDVATEGAKLAVSALKEMRENYKHSKLEAHNKIHKAQIIGDALYKAASNGGGVVGVTGLITAKVAVVGAAATAAAPFIVTAAAVGAIGYGAWKFVEWLDE